MAGHEPPHHLHVFSTFAVGGPQRRFAQLANHFGDRYRHTVIALDGRTDARRLIDPGVALHVIAADRELRARRGLLRALRDYRRQLHDLAPDLLLTYNWGAVEWCLAQRWAPPVRHIHFEDGFGPEESPERQLRRRVLMRRIALGGASRVVVPSRTLERLATEWWRLAPWRVLYVPNGVEADRFAAPVSAAIAQGLRGATARRLVGAVGMLRREKNFARLIRAAGPLAQECEIGLVIAGEGPERAALEATARHYPALPFLLLGAIDRPQDYLGAFDVFALSSDTEQMPYVLLEAMAASRAVVATDVGDVKAIVAEENRPFIVAKDDERAFALALKALLDNADLRRRLGERNRAKVLAEYRVGPMFERYRALFESAPVPRRPRGGDVDAGQGRDP
jgi:glycosyltransferase involved in cell wall biosynthesis